MKNNLHRQIGQRGFDLLNLGGESGVEDGLPGLGLGHFAAIEFNLDCCHAGNFSAPGAAHNPKPEDRRLLLIATMLWSLLLGWLWTVASGLWTFL